MGTGLRWGFLGASRIGRMSLAPAMVAAGQTLHAIAARDLSRAQSFGAEFGFAKAYGGYDALLEDPAVDAVYVALTNDRHLPWVVRALAAGKDVLCEKPLAMDAGEVAQIVHAEQASGRRVSEAFGYRYNHQILRLDEIMAKGLLGEVVAAQVTFGNLIRTVDFRWSAELGGGAMYDIGCYCVDLLRRAIGTEPRTASAVQRLQGGVDLSTAGQLNFPGDVLAQFVCSFSSARRQQLTILGTEALLSLDWPFAPRQDLVSLRIDHAVETFGPSDPYRAMVEAFVAAVQTGGPMPSGTANALPQAHAMDAVFAAARTGQVVPVIDATGDRSILDAS